ncbi:TonB-dependent receptor [Novosphingobium mathurense]|uniref:Iron complex outermembrane recepter protein n=1 Tax=Novosphingobium mathurense TaxID=428990 RepID=A0A1U6HTP9_9SPHN|nr:TonB-dependent receptor [Novosphingobium mathurense]SLJ99021.1 iron complex outermembrane recepter protein [Novosphingobium mathurense]
MRHSAILGVTTGRHAIVAGSLAGLLVAAPALAQDLNSADAADVAQDAGVIIVTAQKRTQDILQVPAAVSAISEKTLDAAQVKDFTDITNVAPSVTVASAGNSASSTVSLRGVGTLSFSTSVEPSVSIVVDDVALLQQGQAFGKLNDIARIEVLRGPQDSLFGKNASAGVINIVTKDPTSTLSGFVEGLMTDDNEVRVNGNLSGPIGDSAGFRVNAFYGDRKGYIRNLTNNSWLNGEESYGFRGKVNYDSGILSVQLIGDYSNTKSSGNQPTYYYVAPGTLQNGRPINLGGVVPGMANTEVTVNDDQLSNTEQWMASAKIGLDLGFASLTSISSYQDWKLDTTTDLDFTPSFVIRQGGPYHAKQYAQELRLTSADTGSFDYLVGLYYADGETDRQFARDTASFLTFLRRNWDSTASTRTLAAFAQLGYDLSEQTKLTVGGRINNEKVGVFYRDNIPATPIVYEGQAKDTAVTGKASLQHFITDELMTYASIATGYKGQAYDISSGFNQSRIDNLVKPENSVAYEVGVKGRFWDNRGSFGLTGFWTDYDDFQAQNVEFVGGAIQPVLRNVGKLRTKGIEFEGTLRPVDGLSLFASAAYVDAKIRKFPNATCYPGQTAAQGCVGGSQDLAGAGLANSPKFKYNIGGNFETPLGNSPISVFTSANYVWQDDVNFALDGNPLTVQKAYGIANATIGLRETENRNWEVSLFVNNLFDKSYAAVLTDYSDNGYTGTAIVQQVPRNYSRYVGIKLRFGFGGDR